MKKILIVIFFFFSLVTSGHINNDTDSLLNLLQTSKQADSARILNELSKEFYHNKKYQKAIDYAEKALKTAITLSMTAEISDAYNNMAAGFSKRNEFSKAVEYFSKASFIAENENNYSDFAKYQRNIALTYKKNNNYDSAFKVLEMTYKKLQSTDDAKATAKVLVTFASLQTKQNDYAEAIHYYELAIDYWEKSGDTTSLAKSCGSLGVIHNIVGNHQEALINLFRSVKLYTTVDNKDGIASYLGSIGNVYTDLKDYDKAYEYYNKAKNMFDTIQRKGGIAASYGNMGIILNSQGKHENALESYFNALRIFKEIDSKIGIETALTNIGDTYEMLEDYDKALEYFLESLKIKEEIGAKEHQTYSLNGIASVYLKRNKLKLSIQYAKKSLELAEETNSLAQIKEASRILSEAFFNLNNYKEAYNYQGRVMKLKDSLYSIEKDKKIAKLQTKFEVEKKEKEIELQKTEIARKDAILKQKNTQRNALFAVVILLLALTLIIFIAYKHRKNTSLKLKKQNDKIENQALTLEINNRELEKLSIVASKTNNAIIISSAEGDIEWVNDSFTKMFGYSLKEFRKERGENIRDASNNCEIKDSINKAIETKMPLFYTSKAETKTGKKIWIQTTLTPITDDSGVIKNIVAIDTDITGLKIAENMIKEQNKQLELKNRNITDSIKYARRIQEAILPPEKIVKQCLEDSFILFKPKDIVSGDFYWIHNVLQKVLFSVVDCTGHGVPGAFVSIVGHNGLNRIVKEMGITKPGLILDKLHEMVLDTFSSQENNDVRDGMDIALCCFDTKTNMLEYAGAYNPLCLVREGHMQEIKADKQSVGSTLRNTRFANNNIQIQKGDTVYIFTDGYSDQFGGEKGKKFMRKPFRDLLLSLQEFSMQEQKEVLNTTINEWQGKLEQVDDILVMGVRI